MSVNTLKNTLMLKKNEIVHANEKIVALNSKLAALSLTMNACEGEKQKKIDTLVVQL